MRKASIRRRRLIAFLRRWPLVVRTSLCSFCPSSSSSMRWISSRTASAPMPAANSRAPPRTPEPYLRSSSRKLQPSMLASGSIMPGCNRLISSRGLADLVLGALGFALEPLTLGLERGVELQAVGLRPVRRIASSCALSRRWISVLTRSISAAAAWFSAVTPALPPLSPAATMISPVGSKTIGSSAAPLPSASIFALVSCCAATSSAGAAGALLLALGLERGRPVVQLVRVAVQVGAKPILELGQALPARPPRPSASSSSCWSSRCARVLIDPRDDVQREVEDRAPGCAG